MFPNHKRLQNKQIGLRMQHKSIQTNPDKAHIANLTVNLTMIQKLTFETSSNLVEFGQRMEDPQSEIE